MRIDLHFGREMENKGPEFSATVSFGMSRMDDNIRCRARWGACEVQDSRKERVETRLAARPDPKSEPGYDPTRALLHAT